MMNHHYNNAHHSKDYVLYFFQASNKQIIKSENLCFEGEHDFSLPAWSFWSAWGGLSLFSFPQVVVFLLEGERKKTTTQHKDMFNVQCSNGEGANNPTRGQRHQNKNMKHLPFSFHLPFLEVLE